MKFFMKLLNTIFVVVLLTFSFSAVFAVTPEQSRKNLIEYFKSKNPDISIDKYKDGGYIYSEDKMMQLHAAEEFPPYVDELDAGEALYNKDKKVYVKCFGKKVSNIRPSFPYYDDRRGEVITLELAINECREKFGLKKFKWKKGKIAQLSGYFASEAKGKKVNVKIDSEGAREAFEEGQKFFVTVNGQLGMSCAKCHVYNAGSRVRADMLSPSIGHTTHLPMYRAKWTSLGTLHRRYVGCQENVRARPHKPQSVVYRNLEFFQAYMSNGLEINGPGYRQ